MSIKVTLGELVASQGALMELGGLASIPPSTLFRVGRAIRKVRDELQEWGKQRLAILKATGVATPHPQITGEVWIDPAAVTMEISAKLDVDMRALNDTDVEIEVGEMKLSEFGDKAIAAMKANWLAELSWLITAE